MGAPSAHKFAKVREVAEQESKKWNNAKMCEKLETRKLNMLLFHSFSNENKEHQNQLYKKAPRNHCVCPRKNDSYLSLFQEVCFLHKEFFTTYEKPQA